MKKEEVKELIYGKLPPQAVELEKVILGAIMLEKTAYDRVSDIIKPECFYKEHHKMIFEAMKSLSNKAMPIDSLTVVDELKKKGTLEEVGGIFYIVTLTNSVASTAHLEGHCLIILHKFMQRELIRIGGELVSDGYKEDIDNINDLFELAEKKIFDVTTSLIKKDVRHISSGVKDALIKVEELKNRDYALTGVPTGFSELDRITNGWQDTDLIILAARPSVGKTALALNFACNAALSREKPTGVAIFSLEMSEGQLVNRILSSETKIPLEWINSGRLSDGKMRQLQIEAQERIAEAPIYIDDTPAMTVFELRSKARKLKLRHNIGLIIIDYLQLMAGDSKSKNREQEISTISRQLKALAKELDVPVIALSQLSREIEKRGGTPKLSDLRESGAIEQDADIVAFISRPSKDDIQHDESVTNTGYIGISKHRNGALADLVLYVDLSIQRWFDMDKGMEYEQQFNKNYIPLDTLYRNPSEPEEAPF